MDYLASRGVAWTCGRSQGSVTGITGDNLPTESRIILRSGALEFGSPAAAFLFDLHDSIFGEAQ